MTTFTARRAYAPRSFDLFGYVVAMYGTWRQRRHLAALDDRARRDIGLTEGEAMREAMRPAWVLGA